MISCLGQQNVDGKRIPYGYTNRTLPHYKQFDDTPKARGFVESSFIKGLTPDELFFHAMGGRVGLIDTAVKTSTTGYIQRRLIKSMEDIQIMYDKTVRNNKNKIIQFLYGGTNYDTTYIEKYNFELLSLNINDIYENYSYDIIINETKQGISKHLKLIYEPSILKKFKEQLPKLKEIAKAEIDFIIQSKNDLIEQIYKNDMKNDIFLPIHFTNLIKSVKEQFGILSSSVSNITPLDAYDILYAKYNILDKLFKPCTMFKIAYIFYLNPFVLIHKHKYNKDAIIFLCEKIIHNYKKSIVNPGEMVGMVSAQSIGEPTTQMTLNTFHFAGVSSKSNVTRGVPRIEELLTLTKKLKNPSLTIYLKEEDCENKDKVYKLASKIQHTKLIDIIDKAEIYYEPKDTSTLIHEDEDFINEYLEFSDLIKSCYNEEKDQEEDNEEEDEEDSVNNWIIRIEMNQTQMLDMNITNEDIHYTLKILYGNDLTCFYSDYNSDDKIIFRIKPQIKQLKKKSVSFTEEDFIYYVKTFMDKILKEIVIRGVKNIEKVNVRSIKKSKIYDNETNNYRERDIYVLDTIGTNLIDILSNDSIDVNNTFSNDVMEMYSVLGIEAARQCLFNELIDVIEFDGTYINHHHMHLLCDRMCCNEKMVSVFRHGINKDDIGPIAKASFEETSEMFLQAAKHGELDELRGVSANIMCGQEGYYGTSAFQTYVDNNKLFELNKMISNNEENEIESYEYNIEDNAEDIIKHYEDIQSGEYGICSIDNLKDKNKLDINMVKNVIIHKEDDDYELDI